MSAQPPADAPRERSRAETLSITATDRSVAAHQIGRLDYHVHVDGHAALETLLRSGADAPVEGGVVDSVAHHLQRQRPDIWARQDVGRELRRLRELPEFNPADPYDDSAAQPSADRVIAASSTAAGVVAVLALWGDSDTEGWWMPQLERLARIEARGGNAWLLNLPLVAASMLFYAGATAAAYSGNYARLARIFALHGEPISPPGAVPLREMLAPNPSSIKLSAAHNFDAVGHILTAVLDAPTDELDDAWQTVEILRLATQLMGHHQFDRALGTWTAALRAAKATATIDPTAPQRAQAALRDALDLLAQCCTARGLHLFAADKIFHSGEDFRWGSPIAERLADEINRTGDRHSLVQGLNRDAEAVELALRAVSRAVGEVGRTHPANWTGSATMGIWLDRP